jgi:hypothetical protein
MATDDFFRARLDQMIDLGHPLAVFVNGDLKLIQFFSDQRFKTDTPRHGKRR